MTNFNGTLNDLFVRPNSSNVTTASFVWDYFGHLYRKPNELLDKDYFYCKICVEQIKEEEPGVSLSSVRNRIGVYKSTSGTGNMKNHLLATHQVTNAQEKKTTKNHILSMFSREKSTTKISQKKQQLGYQLTLMCCRDLLPFTIVENEGRIIKSILDATT